MSKLVEYQGVKLTPQTKIAAEALVLKANRMGLTLEIEQGDIDYLTFKDMHAFLNMEAKKYGFVGDSQNPKLYHFVGVKKSMA